MKNIIRDGIFKENKELYFYIKFYIKNIFFLKKFNKIKLNRLINLKINKFIFLKKFIQKYEEVVKKKVINFNIVNNFRFITQFLFVFQINFYNFLYLLLFKYINYLIYISKNYLSIYVETNSLLINLSYLKLSSFFLFKLLLDITVIDNVNFMLKKRFKLVYNLYSIKFNYRLFINAFIDVDENVTSVYSLYSNSNWLEREVWDMFGIFFINHPDLRRILTDYGFKGYPLRKDFPVSGYVEAWYDDVLQDIIYKPVKLAQEMRFFNFSTVWENLM